MNFTKEAMNKSTTWKSYGSNLNKSFQNHDKQNFIYTQIFTDVQSVSLTLLFVSQISLILKKKSKRSAGDSQRK